MPQTGATRYQKFLKSEKAKTKFKAKKDLPKGTNVTKTNFKVKKIVIKEQLRKHDDTEVLSIRKLNVNELLSRLNHFNTNSRTDALQGLKDLITRNSGVLEQHLGQLINGITPLLLNIEKIVRRNTLQVLHTILTKVRVEKIDPFYDIMSTYLRSAMTHIDNRIQEDSLLFLDILLHCAPKKVANDFHKIIPNFLDMISKLRVDSKPGRTLTVNLGSQITSVKWRVKVLHRLQDYLSKFIQYENVNELENGTVETTKTFDTSKFNYYSLSNPNYVSICPLSCFSSKKVQETIPADEVAKFMEYIDTLMPLLFETWLEVCPNTGGEKNFETVISEDAATLLKYMLEVISLLWALVQYLNKKIPSSDIQNTFCRKYRQQYTQHFVKIFPFVTNIRTKQKTEDSPFENVITDAKLVSENLEICHLYILLNLHVIIKNNNEIVSVLNYIEKIFNQNSQDNINGVVLKILHTLFSGEPNSWTRTSSVMDSLFRKVIWAYFNKSMSNTFKQKIFSLLCTIALNDNMGQFHQCVFDVWLKNLPDILLEDAITVHTVDVLHKFAVQKNNTFNSVIKPKLSIIIDNLPAIKIVDATNDTSYHKLFALLHWIKVWDNDSLNQLETQMLNEAYKHDHVKYIMDTLKIRVSGIP